MGVKLLSTTFPPPANFAAMWHGITRRAFVFLSLGSAIAWALERTPVVSSSIASVGYDAAARALEIEFRNGGLYRYRAVPREVFDGLISAASKGRFFIERIRGKFEFERVPEGKP